MQNFVFEDVSVKISAELTFPSFNINLFEFKFKYINDLQLLNNLCISVTPSVLKFDKSK